MCSRLAISLLAIPGIVFVYFVPALATDFKIGGLSWHIESKGQGASRLDWVEDRDDWADLPKDVPLVLLDPDQDARPGR